MKRKLCEPISGRDAGTKVLTESEVVARGYPKREGILGYVDGIFSVCDKENKNKRMYEHALWEEVHGSERFKGMLDAMTLLGEPDHPETRTQSSIKEGSHTIVDQFTDGNLVKGTVMVFDNPLGQIVWPMLKAGVKLGFSTRGDGDLVEDARTGRTKVDPKSYEYHGVDFVLNPSFVEAGPTAITEEAWRSTRRALTEAVESHRVDEGTQRNVQAILEALKPDAGDRRLVEDEKPKKAPNGKVIENLVAQLSAANDRVAELEKTLDSKAVLEQDVRKQHEQEVGRLVAESKAKDDTLAEAVTRSKTLERQLAKARGDLSRLSEDTKDKVDAARVEELTALLQENQNSHLGLVKSHRELLGKHRKLEAAYNEGLRVLGELKTRLAEAEARAKDADQRAKLAESESATAREDLKAQSATIPNLISNSTLAQYKKIRTEGVDVPDEFARLLEHAGSEEEIDTIMEAISNKQASRYSFLPLGAGSRGLREALAEGIPDERQHEGRATTKEETAEAQQIKEVTERQLGGRRKKG